VKLAVDFRKSRRIILTGSAMTLARDRPESGVGRWHTIRMTTLSFYLYLCRHDGGLLDYQALCSNLQISRRTAERYIDLLEASHLIYRLGPRSATARRSCADASRST